MDEEKICKNCKNFISYYSKTNGLFKQIPVGHCKLDIKKKRLNCFFHCDKWESDADLIKNRHQKIEDILRDMATDLDNILQVLKQE